MSYANAFKSVGENVTPLRGAMAEKPAEYVQEYSSKDLHTVENFDKFDTKSEVKFTSTMSENLYRRKLAGDYPNVHIPASKTFTEAINNTTDEFKKICPDLDAMLNVALRYEESVAKNNARSAEIERSLRDLNSSSSFDFSI